MLRRSRCAPAAAGAATAALAAALWGVPAPLAGAAQAKAAATTISVGATPTFTALAFPAPATGWLLGQAAAGGRAEIWRTGTAGATWQVQWESAGSPLSVTATDPSHAWALIACPTVKGASSPAGGSSWPPPTAAGAGGWPPPCRGP